MNAVTFSKILAQLMQENSVNQLGLANSLGIKQSQVLNWFDAKSKLSYDSIKMLCKFFKVSADLIVGAGLDD